MRLDLRRGQSEDVIDERRSSGREPIADAEQSVDERTLLLLPRALAQGVWHPLAKHCRAVPTILVLERRIECGVDVPLDRRISGKDTPSSSMSSGGISPRRYAPVDCPTLGARSKGCSVRHAPPGTAADSKTRTWSPARASISAATKPLCPAPTIRTSTGDMASVDEETEARFDAPRMVRRPGRHLEVPHPSPACFES